MKCLPPDHVERRGDRTLLVWGDLPFWMVTDRGAAELVRALADGLTLDTATDAARRSGREPFGDHDVAQVLAHLEQAGVIGKHRVRPPRERIESVSINVTNRCNLRCAFCFNAGRRDAGNTPEVGAEAMIAALETVRREIAPGAALALLGGEPLLDKEKTLALARWGTRRKLSPIVSTNGLLMDADFARQAAAVGLAVQVSIDGATAASHEAIRGAGTFEPALAAVRTLVAAGAHTLMSMVFHAGNVDEIPAYLRLAHDIGANEARFIPLKQIGGGSAFAPPPLDRVVRLMTDALQAEPHLGRLLGRDYVSILAQTCHSCSPRQGCGTGSQTLLLDADGTVYPCLNLATPEFAAGNIAEEPLAAIWRRSRVLEDVRRRVCLSARGTCRECFVRHWCLGGCRGETLQVTGNLSGPSPTCAANRAAIIEMFWTLSAHPELLRAGRQYC